MIMNKSYIQFMNIIRHSLKIPIFRSFLRPTPLTQNSTTSFSGYFKEKDQQQMLEYIRSLSHHKKYRGLIAEWQRPLEKKKLRQERVKEIKQNLEENPPQKDIQKFIVHNPSVGIEHPPIAQKVFGVLKLDDRQYKVTKDCILIMDTKQGHEINKKITFDEVLLVGTETYTLLGRPFVENAKIQGVIESISKSEKVIVFKKKRRKQYKKSRGQRSTITSCRITGIVHDIPPEVLDKAVGL